MPFQQTDESKVPMLAIHALGAWDEEDIEENASDTSKHSTSSTLYDHSIRRKHSYNSSWSSSPSPCDKSGFSSRFLTWLRWGIIVILQSTILGLLLCQSLRRNIDETESVLKGKVVETGGDINGLFKTRKNMMQACVC
jgi:hypothetical protein